MSGGSDRFFFVFTSFTLVLFKYFFKTPAVLNLSFHTRTTLFALKHPKAKACFGIVRIFTLGKLSDASMMGRLNTSSPQQKMITVIYTTKKFGSDKIVRTSTPLC